MANAGNDFGWALGQLRAGARVTRLGWNGNLPRPRMWIGLQKPYDDVKMTLPYIYLNTVGDDLVPWLASQTDMLAEDWALFEDVAL